MKLTAWREVEEMFGSTTGVSYQIDIQYTPDNSNLQETDENGSS